MVNSWENVSAPMETGSETKEEKLKKEFETAGLTPEEQGVYQKYLENLEKFSKEISTLSGVVKMSFQGLLGKKEMYSDREKELIISANDKLLNLQKGQKGVDVAI